MSFYVLLKFIHVLAAIIAVGSNMTYGVLLARAHREPEHLRHVRESIRALDRTLANPAYGVLLASGLLMIWLGPVRFTAPWLLVSIILYILVAVLGAVVLAPLSGRELQMLGEVQPDAPAYLRLRRQSARLSGVASLLVLIIAYLMVVKPLLWASR